MPYQIKLPDGEFLRGMWDEIMDFPDVIATQKYIGTRWGHLYPEARQGIEIVEVPAFEWKIPPNLLFPFKEAVDVLPIALALKEAMNMAERLGHYRHFQAILNHVCRFPNNPHVVVEISPYRDWNHHFSFDWWAYDKYDSARQRVTNGGIIFFEPSDFMMPDGETFNIEVPFADHEGWHVCT